MLEMLNRTSSGEEFLIRACTNRAGFALKFTLIPHIFLFLVLHILWSVTAPFSADSIILLILIECLLFYHYIGSQNSKI